jgi:hypothetical protein
MTARGRDHSGRDVTVIRKKKKERKGSVRERA